MELESERCGDVEVVVLSGKMDANCAPELREHFQSLIEAGSHQIVIDLAEVAFVDSSGLSTLVAVFKSARNVGGDLALAGLQATVRSVMELTRLKHVFNIFEARSDAVAFFDA